jgi:hypothetical protein
MTTTIQTRAPTSLARDSRGGDTALPGEASAPAPRDAVPPRRVFEAWTPDRVEQLTRLWADGLSAAAIARQLGGVTRNAVLGKVHRAPELFARRKQSNRRGQPRLKYDHNAALNMWAAGKSADQIAAARGMSRHAVYKIMQAARKRGDARAMLRHGGSLFTREALRRGMTPAALRVALLRTIRTDNLFDAVLGKPGEPA